MSCILTMMIIKNEDFEKIALTNIRPAFHRAKPEYNIPYAKEMWDAMKSMPGFSIAEAGDLTKAEPYYAARHNLMDSLAKSTGAVQFLEIAAGWSTRGLTVCKRNEDAVYVELDLPDAAKSKYQAIWRIENGEIPSNLFIHGGNALSYEDFSNATSHFDLMKPVCVITEGLLGYLSMEEKEQITRNIQLLLAEHGGTWVTNDFKSKVKDPNEQARIENYTRKLTGRAQQDFENDDQARRFLARFGMNCEFHSSPELQTDRLRAAYIGFSKDARSTDQTDRR